MRLFQINKQIYCLAGGRLFCTGGFLGVPLEAQGGPYALFKLTKVEKVKIPVVFFCLMWSSWPSSGRTSKPPMHTRQTMDLSYKIPKIYKITQ